MASRGRRRSILKPPNTNEQDPEDNGGYTEKLDTQTIYLPRKRVSFSHRHEVKEFQNVPAEDRSNSICVEPSIMDMTMQNPTNVDDSIENDNSGGAGIANMSMTCIIPSSSGERGDKTFIENTNKSGKNMCMTFTIEQPQVINEQQNRYRDVTFAVGDVLNKDSNFEMSMTRGLLNNETNNDKSVPPIVLQQFKPELEKSATEEQQQEKQLRTQFNSTNIEQPNQYGVSPDMSMTISGESPPVIPQRSSSKFHANSNVYPHEDLNYMTKQQQQQYQQVPAESMMMETTNFENDDVFLPNPIHNQRNETCFEFENLPQNMSKTEIWESSKYHHHQPPVNFDQTKVDFANMSIEPSQFSKTVNVKIPKSYNQTLGNFENPNMSMTINDEVREMNKTTVSNININLEKTGLPFNPDMSMTINNEGNKTKVNHLMNLEQTNLPFNPNMSMTLNLNSTKISNHYYLSYQDPQLTRIEDIGNRDMSITMNPSENDPSPLNKTGFYYETYQEEEQEEEKEEEDGGVNPNAMHPNHTQYYPDKSMTLDLESLIKLSSTQIQLQDHNNIQEYSDNNMSITMAAPTVASSSSQQQNTVHVNQNQIFQQTQVQNLDMSQTRFEVEEEEEPVPIKKVTKSKSGHSKTNINKNLEKTTIGNANMSITTNIPSSASLQFNNLQKGGNLEQTQIFQDVSMTMDLEKSKIPSQRRLQQQQHHTIIQPQEQEYSDMSMTIGALTVSSQVQTFKMPCTEPVVENQNPTMTMMASNKSDNTNNNNKTNTNNNNKTNTNNDRSELDNKRKTYIVAQKNEIVDKTSKMPQPTSSIQIPSTTKSRLPSKSDNRRSKIAVPDNSAFGRFGSSKTPRRKLPSDLFSGIPSASSSRTSPTSTKIPVPINSPIKKKSSSSSSLSSPSVQVKQGTLSNVNQEGKKNNNMVSLKPHSSPSLELLPPTIQPKSNENKFKSKRRIVMGQDTSKKEGSKADDVKSPSVHQHTKTIDSNNKYIHNLITTTTTKNTLPPFTNNITVQRTPPRPSSSTDIVGNNNNNNNKDDEENDNNLEEYSTPLKTISSDKKGILIEPDLVPETVRSSTIFTNSPGYNITLSATNNNYQQKSNDITMASTTIIGPIISTTPTIFSPKTIERPIISPSPFTLSPPLGDISYSPGVKVSTLDDTFNVPPLRPLPSHNQPQQQQQQQQQRQLFVPASPEIIVPVQSVKVRELNKIEDPKKQRKEMHQVPPIVNDIQNPKNTTLTTTNTVTKENNSNNKVKNNNSKVPLNDKIVQLKLLKGLRLQRALANFSKSLQVLDDPSFDLVIKEITGFVNPDFIQAELKLREYSKFMHVMEFPTKQSDPYGLLAFAKQKLAEIP